MAESASPQRPSRDKAPSAVTPYGLWPSPIDGEQVARQATAYDAVHTSGEAVYWLETRPSQDGRAVVVRWTEDTGAADAVPAGFDVGSRVHEYGGGAYLPAGRTLFACSRGDQRLYRIDGQRSPVPITPEPPTPAGLRYADLRLVSSGTLLVCVRERHQGEGVVNELVAVPAKASADPWVMASGHDFYAAPRPSPDGRRLGWLTWDRPCMPWDGADLWVADLGPDGRLGAARHVAGGPQESVVQPEWDAEGVLHFVSDRSGWWNLYRLPAGGGEPEPLCPRAEEFGQPLWQLGAVTYARLADGRLAVLHGTDTLALGLLDPATGELTDLDLPYTLYGSVAVDGDTVLTTAASPVEPAAVVAVDLPTGTATVLRRSMTDPPDPAYLPEPRSIVVAGPGERDVHAHVYPPTSPDAAAPDGELPPYVVFVHGGPTSHSAAILNLEKAYFTSRGIGVIDVNYGGSTGYGRAYRERLRREWGIVDVEDCVAAVQALVRDGLADGDRLGIRGGSAGGWTTLAALTTTDAFAAGVSYYGVAELIAFAADTHDFESRYIDGLVGTLPEDRDVYVERAPLSHVDQLSCPVLLLQGLEDKVVPPAQAELFAAALDKKGIPYAYLPFAGEQHGFRKQETVVAALEAELSFYGQVFGFDPAGVPTLPLTRGQEG